MNAESIGNAACAALGLFMAAEWLSFLRSRKTGPVRGVKTEFVVRRVKPDASPGRWDGNVCDSGVCDVEKMVMGPESGPKNERLR